MGGLLSRISLRLSTGSVCVMAFAGCGDGSGPGDNDQTIQYQVALAAFADDSPSSAFVPLSAWSMASSRYQLPWYRKAAPGSRSGSSGE
jgi:hypothetical protein